MSKAGDHRQLLRLAVSDSEAAILEYLNGSVSLEEINATDSDGKNPLWWCASRGQAAAVTLLLKKGVRTESEEGRTPLMIAAERGHVDAVRALVKGRADLNVETSEGLRPLCFAVLGRESRATVDTIRTLIQAGASIDARDNSGMTALMFAAAIARTKESAESIRVLLEHGADVNAADDNGWTPLLWARRGPTADVVKLLLQANANPNAQDGQGRTVLMLSSYQENTGEIVQALLDGGADAFIKDSHGSNALWYAVMGDRRNALLSLLDAMEGHNFVERGRSAKKRRTETGVMTVFDDTGSSTPAERCSVNPRALVGQKRTRSTTELFPSHPLRNDVSVGNGVSLPASLLFEAVERRCHNDIVAALASRAETLEKIVDEGHAHVASVARSLEESARNRLVPLLLAEVKKRIIPRVTMFLYCIQRLQATEKIRLNTDCMDLLLQAMADTEWRGI